MVAKFKLRLYVEKGNSGQALSLLYKALECHSYTDYELAIIDIHEESGRALADGITKTPTLVSDGDGRKLISHDLFDTSTLRLAFGFKTSKQ